MGVGEVGSSYSFHHHRVPKVCHEQIVASLASLSRPAQR
jgi:hypothetical protein